MTVPYTFANQTGSIPLAELDANFAAVPNYANTAGTVTQNAQTNITTVGTLNNLDVAGNLTTNYLFQSSTIISLGNGAGYSGNIDTIAIGNSAAHINQGTNAIALGSYAGYNTQASFGIAIGRFAGTYRQQLNSIAIGHVAGNIGQGANVVAIGYIAGSSNSGDDTIAIGTNAGNLEQSAGAVAIGRFAGNSRQGANSVSLGRNAGNLSQGIESVAIGHSAGNNNQGNYATAVGSYSGNNIQGDYSVAIGSFAGYPTIANSAIVINGLTTPLNGPNTGFYVAPVRNDTGNVTNTVYYNTSTNEITYAVNGAGYGNAQVAEFLPTYSGSMLDLDTVAAAGNITGDYIFGNGSFLTGITTSSSNILYGSSSINIPSPGNNITVTVGGTTSAVFFTSGMSLPGNVTASNVNANYVYGNGSQLASLAGANVTGVVANATYATSAGTATSATTAGTVTTAAQPSITSVGTLTSLSVSGNINASTINSAATINLAAVNVVDVTRSLFRLASYTTSQATALTPQIGDMIFNNTLGNVQIYTGTKWGNVVVS